MLIRPTKPAQPLLLSPTGRITKKTLLRLLNGIENENSLAERTRGKPAPEPASTGPGGLKRQLICRIGSRAFRAFEEANGRPATRAETRILTEIAALFDQTAIDQGPSIVRVDGRG